MYLGWDSLCDSRRSYFLLVGREREKKWRRSLSNVAFQIASIVSRDAGASSCRYSRFHPALETFTFGNVPPQNCAFIRIVGDIIITIVSAIILAVSSAPGEWTCTDHHAVGVHDTHPAAIFWAGHRRQPTSLPPSPPLLPCPTNDLVC